MDNQVWAFWCGWMSGVGIGAGIMFFLMLDVADLIYKIKLALWMRLNAERESK